MVFSTIGAPNQFGNNDIFTKNGRFLLRPFLLLFKLSISSPHDAVFCRFSAFVPGSAREIFDERIEQKIFHAEIVVDNAAVARETKAYRKIPQIVDFCDENGTDRMYDKIPFFT
jgi:hypothetical protein